jgi:hypothetical protein
MKGQEIVNAIVRANMPDIARVRERCLQQPFPERAVNPLYRRPCFLFATAAALAVCVIVGSVFIFSGDGGNVFVAKTYAFHEMEDGSVELREVEVYGDNDNGLYLTITLMDGAAKSVGVYTSNHVFLRQYDKTGGFTADEYPLLISGLLAHSYNESEGLPQKINLHAKLKTLDPGELPDGVSPGDFTISIGSHETTGDVWASELAALKADMKLMDELIRRIPLDACAPVAGSEEALSYGDVYDYPLGGGGITGKYPIIREMLNATGNRGLYEDNGVLKVGGNLPSDGSDGYIAVIAPNADGTYAGMVYRVPGAVILEAWSQR